MKKVFIVCFLIALMVLSAQDQSASFGISAKIEGNNSAQWETQAKKDAILQNLKVLEEKYVTQLPKKQYLEASMLIEEIREILLGNTEAKTEVNTKVNTSTESSQSVNINMNISGFDNPAAPQPQAVPVADPVAAKPVVEAVEVPKPMNSAAFSQLVSNIEDESFADDQLLYIRTAAQSHNFSVSQITQLIELFTFSEDQISCLRITYPKAVDKENAFTIISHFTYEDDKKAAQSIISQ
ncbi:MAG: DUF4476 domain-containing protein [Candidatus Cloacimonetes bacterium]|nr:DUF4476 domain-containing protein [Candidatus Cloacimonadota bacterium]